MILKFYKFKKFCMDIFTILYSIWSTGLNMFNKRETRMYPDIPLSLAPRFRGRIVLTRNSDGSERCVACNLCAVSCPVDCISLKKSENSKGCWYPEFFRINFARCIFCGMCEEACPTMAIQLIPDCEMGEFKKQDLMYEKTDLLISGPGKYPDYNFYNVTGVKIKNKLKGEGDNEFVPVDIKSLLP